MLLRSDPTHHYLPACKKMFRPISNSDNVVYIFVKSLILTTSSLGIVVRIPDCHLGDRGSNPGSGGRISLLFFYLFLTFFTEYWDFFEKISKYFSFWVKIFKIEITTFLEELDNFKHFETYFFFDPIWPPFDPSWGPQFRDTAQFYCIKSWVLVQIWI